MAYNLMYLMVGESVISHTVLYNVMSGMEIRVMKRAKEERCKTLRNEQAARKEIGALRHSR